MSAMAYQITSHTIVYSTVYSGTDKKNIKAPRHWPLWGDSTGEFPAQRASNAKNVSIWWRHHGNPKFIVIPTSSPLMPHKIVMTPFRCHQWRQRWHHDKVGIMISVGGMAAGSIVYCRHNMAGWLTSAISDDSSNSCGDNDDVIHGHRGSVCLGNYRQVSNIRRTLVRNKLVDHSDVVGASPVGAAPTTSSRST